MELIVKDITINEADGHFDLVEKLMTTSTAAPLGKWMLETEVGILRGSEDSYMVVQFWNNNECILKEFSTNFISEYMPVDLIFMHEWLKERGWSFVIDDDLRDSAPEYWMVFDQIITDEEFVEEEIDYDDEDYDDEMDFIEYGKKMQEYKKPTVNKYSAVEELPEFESHKYDLEKRAEEEGESWF